MRAPVVAALVAAILIPSIAEAQTRGAARPSSKSTAQAQGQTGATAPAPADQVTVPVRPQAATPLPEAQPVPAAFSLGPVEGVTPALIAGVTAKGYARKVTVAGKPIGQVLVTSVAKGEREEVISSEGLTAQFDAKDERGLFPEKALEVTGSKTALVAALERLAKVEKKEEAKKTASEPGAQPQASSGKSGNDLASQYRAPSVSGSTPAATKEEAKVETRITTEGCPVRIDAAQGKAIRQSKTQTYTDGSLSADGTCSDSEVSFVLNRNYAACPSDRVDLTRMQAFFHYVLTYTDDAAETHTVGECTEDAASPSTITEDESQCPVFLDFNAKQAVPQAALVYLNRSLAPVQARGCAASTKSAPSPMSESVAACPMRHDFTAGLSYELSMWTYQRGGVTYQAAPCADTGRSFAQEIVYSDATGALICPTITNLDARTVTLQSRRRITVDGTPGFITDCTPDTTSQAVLSTTDGCMDPSTWVHDIEAGQSYGQERFYYLRNGSREYLTACRTSTVTYRQDQTITGWQNHDDQLWAYPLSTVTITVAAKPYTIVNSQVLPGAAQMAYVLNGTADQPNGTSTYDGCNAWRATDRVESWKRPDGSLYLKPIGAGATQGPVNVCTSTVIDSRTITLSTSTTVCYGGGGSVSTLALVNKTQTKNTETGLVLATTCAKTSTWTSGGVAPCALACGDMDCPPAGGDTTVYIPAIPPCPF